MKMKRPRHRLILVSFSILIVFGLAITIIPMIDSSAPGPSSQKAGQR